MPYAMETVYKEIIKIDKFENLNFYDARAVIKKFGSEKFIILDHQEPIQFLIKM